MENRAVARRRLRLRAAVCVIYATAFQTACCPDTTSEQCATLAQWRDAASCSNFPDPADGGQCPAAEAVAKSCGTKAGRMRINGDKCCYQMPAVCE
jgi:hypothetical protein